MEENNSENIELRPWWEMDWATRTPLYANGVSYQAYYSGVGKAHYMGKDLTEVRSPQRKYAPDNAGPEKGVQTSLRGIAIKAKAKEKHRFQKPLPMLECVVSACLLEGSEQECCQWRG